MEELKIWSIDNVRNAKVTALDTAAQTESEGLLEDILTRNPDMLSEGLKLIGRQTRTTGGLLRCAPRAEGGCRIDGAECGGGRSVPSACLVRNGGTAERRAG